MIKNWKTYKLGEVYEFTSGLSKGREYFGKGYDFVTFKDVFSNIFLPEKLTGLVDSTEYERKKCSVKRGDAFLTRTSETNNELGLSSVALKDYENATFNGFTKRLRPNGVIPVSPEFAAFYFRSPKFRGKVSQFSSMTTRASLNNGMLANLTIDLPPLDLQILIGNILKSITDRIELNIHMNQTLEAMALAIFKHWFVDFQFPGFKGKFKENLPEGWKIGKLVDLASDEKNSIVDGPFGTQMKVGEYTNEGIPVIEMEYLEGVPFYKPFNKFITKEKYEEVKRSSVKPGDILLSKTGTLGLLGIMSDIYDKAIIVSRLAKITPHPEKSDLFFLFFCLKMLNEKNYWNSVSSGSTMPIINLTLIKSAEIVVPEISIQKKFGIAVGPLFRRLENNLRQNQALKEILETLLPKLITGNIEIKG